MMNDKVVLFDVENTALTASFLKELIEHSATLYLFNCQNKFEYELDALNELAGWIASGQLVILDVPETTEKEFEYAVIVGQLLALIDHDSDVEVISAVDSIHILLDMLAASDISCQWIKITKKQQKKSAIRLPSVETILKKPQLQMVKQYCDALAKMSGKPNTIEKMINSMMNILHIVPEKANKLVGVLINLNIIKREDGRVSFRKKIIKQWEQLDLNAQTPETELQDVVEKIDQVLSKIHVEKKTLQLTDPQQALFKNFYQIDPVQVEIAKKLRELKTEKPKDIYALRDLLEQLFPQSDVRLLLKELIEKGYIYWNGHEVLYSHEMFLN